jgi:hypothetical protein
MQDGFIDDGVIGQEAVSKWKKALHQMCRRQTASTVPCPYPSNGNYHWWHCGRQQILQLIAQLAIARQSAEAH